MDGECLECLIKAKCTIHQPPIFKVPGEINKNKLPGNKGARAQRRRRTPPPKRERSTNYFSVKSCNLLSRTKYFNLFYS